MEGSVQERGSKPYISQRYQQVRHGMMLKQLFLLDK